MVDPWQKVKKNTHAIRFKEDAVKFTCEFCDKQFYSKLGYTSHLRLKHYVQVGERTDTIEPEPVFVKDEHIESEGDFTDGENGFEYEEMQVLSSEKEMKNSSKEFVCSCGDKFVEFIDLVRHESSKHTEGFEKMVKGLKDLLLYVINRAENENLKESTPKNEKTIFIKKEEGMEFEPAFDDFYEESDESESKKGKEIAIKKETLNKTVKQRSVSGNYTPKKPPKQDKFLCQYCDKQLAHKKSLEYHVAKKHLNSTIFRCKLCNRYFTDELEYQIHVSTHENDPELCCSSCGFLCKGTAVLRRHVAQKHTRIEMEPRFFCSTCDKGFFYKCKLDEHVIIHKPATERHPIFQCDICNNAFTRKSALNRHKLTHDETTKTFTCTFCAKTFRRKQHLVAHLAMHTGARPREEICADCGAVYSERRGLYNHMLRVHGRPLEGYKKQLKQEIVKETVQETVQETTVLQDSMKSFE